MYGATRTCGKANLSIYVVTISFTWATSRSEPALGIDDEIESADGHTRGGHNPGGQIGISDGVEVVQEETALIGEMAGAGFKEVFREGERAGPGRDLHQDSPEECDDVQRC